MNYELTTSELWIEYYEWSMNWLQVNFLNSTELGINCKLFKNELRVNYKCITSWLWVDYEWTTN
jgi:hypothetical protein